MEKVDIENLVEELLKPTVETLIKDVQTFMSESADSLDKRLKTLEGANSTPTKPQDPTESAMDARIKALEAQLKDAEDKRIAQEKQAASLRFDSSLSAALDDLKPLHKGTVQELLSTRLKQDAVEKDGSWLTKNGQNLSEAISEFFTTDAGKHFLPSNHKDGAGSKEAEVNRSLNSITTAEALRQAFI